jgi:invasion protein IalB
LQGKVNSNMANSLWHPGVGARIARAGAIAFGVLLGGTMLLDISAPDGALAQGKKDAKKDAKADAKSSAPEGAWVKICEKVQHKGKDKDGKDVTQDVEECSTLTEQIHPDNGVTMVGTRLQQMKVDGKELKPALILTVPPGVVLPMGAAITVFPKDLWERVQKKGKLEKADLEKLKKNEVKLGFTFCLQTRCNAEAQATPEFIELLKSGAGFIVTTLRLPGTVIEQQVPLGGFAQALAGPPTDIKQFAAARQEVMKEIAERHKKRMAELRKQQEDLNKMQPNVKADDKKKK